MPLSSMIIRSWSRRGRDEGGRGRNQLTQPVTGLCGLYGEERAVEPAAGA